eukprot:gene6123-8293_t
MTMSTARQTESAADELRRVLRSHPELIRDDAELLADLGLRVDAANIVDFGPAALAGSAALGQVFVGRQVLDRAVQPAGLLQELDEADLGIQQLRRDA